MRIIDENGKLFGKINLVDLGIIFVIIFAISIVGIKILNSKSEGTENALISYTICVEGVREQSVGAISMQSENIIDAEKDELLGRIVDIKKEQATEMIEMADGTVKMGKHPEKFDLYITLEVEGIVSADGYFTKSGKKIMYGDTIGINNGYSQMFGMVENIKTVEG